MVDLTGYLRKPLSPLPAPTTEEQSQPQPLSGGMSARPLSPMNGPLVSGYPSSMASEPAPVSQPSSSQSELKRLTAAPLPSSNPEAHTKADTGQAGVDQIHNPILRGAAHIGDALLGGLFPGIALGLPGTTLHHQYLVNRQAGNVHNEEAVKTGESTRAHQAADTAHLEGQTENLPVEADLKKAQTKHALAQTNELEHPAAAEEKWIEGKLPETDPAHPDLGPQAVFYNAHDPTKKSFGQAPVAAAPTNKQPVEGELPLKERVPQLNKMLEERYGVLHKGEALPEHFKLPDTATQKDYDRIHQALQSVEMAHGTQAQQASTKALHEQALAIAQGNHADAQAERAAKTDFSHKETLAKHFAPASDAAERMNIMSKNYEDGLKGDQQAMVSLLMNHIGMTLGAQKGARITKDVIHEAANSLPWIEKIPKQFDSNGVLSGVTLSPDQMKKMVGLGREKVAEEYQKSKNVAKYVTGSEDEGPERTPSESTINHYTKEAGGDRTKAAQLLRSHGWAVKGETGTSGTVRARDEKGQLHEAPTGSALPKGWKLEK